jgi:hypothetical protein
MGSRPAAFVPRPLEQPAVPSAQRQVFRPVGAVVLWWVWAAFAAANLADLAVAGRSHSAAVVAAVVVFLTGVMYACALRPRVVADETGITLVNPLREYRVPWGAVSAVDVRDTLRVHCRQPGGRDKVLHSWAVQSSRRSRDKAEFRARRSAGPRAGYLASDPRLPPEAAQLLRKSQAELTADALAARAAAARGAAAGTGQGAAVLPAAAWTGRWAWPVIAAVVLPALLLAAVILL